MNKRNLIFLLIALSIVLPVGVWFGVSSEYLGTGETINIIFDEPGTYTITAKVTDSGGLTATDAVTVTVNPLPPPEPPPPPPEPPPPPPPPSVKEILCEVNIYAGTGKNAKAYLGIHVVEADGQEAVGDARVTVALTANNKFRKFLVANTDTDGMATLQLGPAKGCYRVAVTEVISPDCEWINDPLEAEKCF